MGPCFLSHLQRHILPELEAEDCLLVFIFSLVHGCALRNLVQPARDEFIFWRGYVGVLSAGVGGWGGWGSLSSEGLSQLCWNGEMVGVV